MIVAGEEMPTEYLPYVPYIYQEVEEYLSPLLGKSVYWGGDSIANGTGAGNFSYGNIIATKNKMPMTKNTVNGSTLAIRDGRTDSILEKLQEDITEAYDYIVLEGGMNDLFNKVPIGVISQDFIGGAFDTTTLSGAMEKNM